MSVSKAIILNLSDGVTTPMSFLLPAVIGTVHFDARSLTIGCIGAAISMAYAYRSAEGGGWLAAFLSSLIAGIVPILLFMLLPEPFSATLTGLWVGIVIALIVKEKSPKLGLQSAIIDTLKNIVPALIIVGVLSLI